MLGAGGAGGGVGGDTLLPPVATRVSGEGRAGSAGDLAPLAGRETEQTPLRRRRHTQPPRLCLGPAWQAAGGRQAGRRAQNREQRTENREDDGCWERL
ncbi:hypothetical protein CRUP_014624 [Coryphaenoides rupestris]|nr:hypothetical protein CRUP_014624 [Coryphaenoides rupestris]